jgi:hypothetical protein
MVTIIDRTGEQHEVKYDQVVYAFGKKSQLILPMEVATWLFRGARHYIHTTDGQYVRRYGVVDAPEEWVAEMGMDVLETDSLVRDITRLEGWDAEAADPLRAQTTRVLDLKSTPARPRAGDYVNQGTAGSRVGS